MNTNLIHNISNVVFGVIGVLAATDWTQLGLSSEHSVQIIGGLMVAQNALKLIMNISRDGLLGLLMEQPPVKPSSASK